MIDLKANKEKQSVYQIAALNRQHNILEINFLYK